MADKKKNLSEFSGITLDADTSTMRIGMLVSQWNPEVTMALKEGALQTLRRHGVTDEHIAVYEVPGSFELTAAAAMMASSVSAPEAIICLGCIIQGETRHFEFIAQAVAQGISSVGISKAIPVIFGVLTTDTLQQALDRSGGRHGNKGDEAAMAAMQMVALKRSLSSQ